MMVYSRLYCVIKHIVLSNATIMILILVIRKGLGILLKHTSRAQTKGTAHTTNYMSSSHSSFSAVCGHNWLQSCSTTLLFPFPCHRSPKKKPVWFQTLSRQVGECSSSSKRFCTNSGSGYWLHCRLVSKIALLATFCGQILINALTFKNNFFQLFNYICFGRMWMSE